jgi:hypothetical protein
VLFFLTRMCSFVLYEKLLIRRTTKSYIDPAKSIAKKTNKIEILPRKKRINFKIVHVLLYLLAYILIKEPNTNTST